MAWDLTALQARVLSALLKGPKDPPSLSKRLRIGPLRGGTLTGLLELGLVKVGERRRYEITTKGRRAAQ